MRYEIADSSGVTALLDLDRYHAFVSRHWTMDMLMAHFRSEMERQSILIWSPGAEMRWNVEVRFEPTGIVGYREVTGPLRTLRGRLFLATYESLAEAATWDEVHLPEERNSENVIIAQAGDYNCRIVQLYEAEAAESFDEERPHFVIEILRTDALAESWTDVAWRE